MLDVIWISAAFLLGLGARFVGLPPLVGFLLAGFVLAGFGVEADDVIREFSEMGVTLLLFSIGLKLELKSLAKPRVWGTAGVHMAIIVAVAGALAFGLGALGVAYFDGMDLFSAAVLGFALSFSSTVFAVKVLEDKGEEGSLYGTIAIGILIMQDLAAVVFLAFSAGKIPTFWALLLLLLIPGRKLLSWIMDHAGHGELLILLGLALALGGAQVFDLVGVKGDLGALILGILVSQAPKAKELSRALLGFKDLFLVGFFLSIGLGGMPTLGMLGIALLLMILVPLKAWLFHRLLLVYSLRARTAFLSSASLANYSEFGLIVATIGAANGWIAGEWLAIIAIALSISFVAAAPVNTKSHRLYERFSSRLRRRERKTRVKEEEEIVPGDADVVVCGMGRIGTGAYEEMVAEGRRPLGIDADPGIVAHHIEHGRNAILGSATDADFWHRVRPMPEKPSVGLVLLALPQLSGNVFAAEQLRQRGFTGHIGAIAKYIDDEPVLAAAGVDRVFNLYAEAGAGLAHHASEQGARSARSDAGELG